MRMFCLGFLFLIAILSTAQQSTYIDAPDVKMKIHTLTLEGAEGVDLHSISRELETLDLGYEPSCTDGYIREVIKDWFQRHGYFKADIGEPRCSMLRRSKNEVWIDVRVRVHPGAVFRLKEISFSRSTAFTPHELRKQIPMSEGDVFRVDGMRAGLKNLREIYCRMGYVNFTPVPNTQIDEASKEISVIFDLDEGDKFFYGTLAADGPESLSGARQKLAAAWKGYEGNPYDCGASLESFLHHIHALPNIKPDEVFKLSFDSQMHSVAVGITLAKPLDSEVAEKHK